MPKWKPWNILLWKLPTKANNLPLWPKKPWLNPSKFRSQQIFQAIYLRRLTRFRRKVVVETKRLIFSWQIWNKCWNKETQFILEKKFDSYKLISIFIITSEIVSTVLTNTSSFCILLMTTPTPIPCSSVWCPFEAEPSACRGQSAASLGSWTRCPCLSLSACNAYVSICSVLRFSCLMSMSLSHCFYKFWFQWCFKQ